MVAGSSQLAHSKLFRYCATPNLLGQPVAADSGLGVLANE